jgi:hypothetical protein
MDSLGILGIQTILSQKNPNTQLQNNLRVFLDKFEIILKAAQNKT